VEGHVSCAAAATAAAWARSPQSQGSGYAPARPPVISSTLGNHTVFVLASSSPSIIRTHLFRRPLILLITCTIVLLLFEEKLISATNDLMRQVHKHEFCDFSLSPLLFG